MEGNIFLPSLVISCKPLMPRYCILASEESRSLPRTGMTPASTSFRLYRSGSRSNRSAMKSAQIHWHTLACHFQQNINGIIPNLYILRTSELHEGNKGIRFCHPGCTNCSQLDRHSTACRSSLYHPQLNPRCISPHCVEHQCSGSACDG